MQKHKVTIGISALNEEGNIQKLLLSLLSQRQQGFEIVEIIVISDGSTDSTCDKVREIKNKKIHLIEHKARNGQNLRQNEIIERMSKNSTALLMLEADWLPESNEYIRKMISAIPKNNIYSMVTGNSLPAKEEGFWGQVMNCGFYFRRDLFKESTKKPNLYTGFGGRLFSRNFLSTFRWEKEYHEDSYSYRKAVESGLPIVFSKNANIFFKSVTNISDYFLQSGKFQKAKQKECTQSKIYNVHFSFIKACRVIFRHFIRNPILLSSYLIFSIPSRINSLFLPNYTVFWRSYRSSKRFSEKNVKYTGEVRDCFSFFAPIYGSEIVKNRGRRYLSNLETDYIYDYMLSPNLNVLDLGIGTGRNSNIILSKGNKVTGLDISLEMLRQTKKNLDKFYRANKLRVFSADLNKKLTFRDNEFDSAICIRVIKYVKNWKKLLKEINRVLKNNSRFIVEISNKRSVQFFSQKYNLYFTFDENEFEKTLYDNGFKVISKKYGMKIPLFIYDLFDYDLYVKALIAVEDILARAIGGKFSRNIMYTCLKTDSRIAYI